MINDFRVNEFIILIGHFKILYYKLCQIFEFCKNVENGE